MSSDGTEIACNTFNRNHLLLRIQLLLLEELLLLLEELILEEMILKEMGLVVVPGGWRRERHADPLGQQEQ